MKQRVFPIKRKKSIVIFAEKFEVYSYTKAFAFSCISVFKIIKTKYKSFRDLLVWGVVSFPVFFKLKKKRFIE